MTGHHTTHVASRAWEPCPDTLCWRWLWLAHSPHFQRARSPKLSSDASWLMVLWSDFSPSFNSYTFLDAEVDAFMAAYPDALVLFGAGNNGQS
jgi:hypothetical protein